MKKTKQPSSAFIYGLMLIGAGLIALGAVLFLALNSSRASADQNSNLAIPDSTIPVEVDYAAPELKLTDLEGKPVALTDYSGKVALVNMWATWCPPCKAEMPALKAFYEKYKSKGFVIVGVNDGDTLDLVAPFVKEYGLTFPVWLDEQYQSEKAFNTMNQIGRAHV